MIIKLTEYQVQHLLDSLSKEQLLDLLSKTVKPTEHIAKTQYFDTLNHFDTRHIFAEPL